MDDKFAASAAKVVALRGEPIDYITSGASSAISGLVDLEGATVMLADGRKIERRGRVMILKTDVAAWFESARVRVREEVWEVVTPIQESAAMMVLEIKRVERIRRSGSHHEQATG